MKIENIKKWSYKIILCILLILVLYVTYCSIFDIYGQSIEMKPIVIILGVIVCIFTFLNIKRLMGKIKENKSNILALGICIIFFIGLSIFGSKMTAIPQYDLSSIQREVQQMLENGGNFVSTPYFEGYRNQIPLTIFIYYIYKIGSLLNISNLKIFATVINSLFIAITAFFTYLSVKKLKDHKLGLTTLIFFVINPIFYLYASYFYSDTLCMPFAAIALYLFIVAIKSVTTRKRIVLLVFSGLILAIGFKIRVVLGILLIGMIIGLILDNKFSKKIAGNIISLIAGFIIGIQCFNLILIPFNISYDKNKEIPVTHWMKLGLNVETDGGYIQSDYDKTAENPTYKKKIKSDLKIIKKRLKSMGLKGWIELSKTKLNRTWSNGDYKYVDKLQHVDEVNKIYEYVAGNKRVFIIYYCQIMKATMLLIFAISIAKELKSREKEKLHSVIYISMFGAFLFYMIWEVLSRYSLTFLPWMMLVFGIGITQIEKITMTNKIELELKENKRKYLNLKRTNKIIVTSVMICSVFLLIISYYTYAVEQKQYSDVVILQDALSSVKTQKISNKTIEQTFKTSNKFNSISLYFYKDDVKSLTNYELVLYDKNKNIIIRKKFDSDDVPHNDYKLFRFEKITPNGEEEYTITITSKDATTNNTLLVSTSWQDNWVPYPDGTFTINGKEIDGSLSFKVEKMSKRKYTTKTIYISLSILIMLIEIFAFYPIIKTNKNINEI